MNSFKDAQVIVLEGVQPLVALKVNPFTIHFPIPALLPNHE